MLLRYSQRDLGDRVPSVTVSYLSEAEDDVLRLSDCYRIQRPQARQVV
jgi:hypothetical protein